jgi:hypothetical protein
LKSYHVESQTPQRPLDSGIARGVVLTLTCLIALFFCVLIFSSEGSPLQLLVGVAILVAALAIGPITQAIRRKK